MEALRDLALADYENLQDKCKIAVHDQFKEMIADGSDFSEYFRNYSFSMPNILESWLNTCEIYKKKRLDFEDFVTLTYIFDNAEAVIFCKGCSSLITGRPYFICNVCFHDLSNGRSYNLCCDCYRSKNFGDHQHTSFSCNHLVLHRTRVKAVVKEKDQERRNELIERALIEFFKEFVEFGRSITTDPDDWKKRLGRGLNLKKDENAKEDEEEEKSTSISRAQGSSRRRYIDLLGVQPSETAGIMIRNN